MPKQKHPTPTPAQFAALYCYAKAHGRRWKSKLTEAWMTGEYDRTDDSMNLQQIRNTFGASWLLRFKLPTPATAPAPDADAEPHKKLWPRPCNNAACHVAGIHMPYCPGAAPAPDEAAEPPVK